MFDSRRLSDQVIALAGLFQSIELVQQCARSGQPSDTAAMCVVLESVLRIDAADVPSVYGELSGLRPGLSLLAQHMSRRLNAVNLEQARYASSLISLERQVTKSTQLSAQLGSTLRELSLARADAAIDSPTMVRQLAATYLQHVSTLLPRVMVGGEPVHLQSPENAERIRALLLAGLRATVLWRQCGGNRLHMLLFRSQIRQVVAQLLESSP
ncbi:MAG: high frequency lysogenization protein [Gammaproteobacteria bacterium]|jgi:high frequency lysogenization protein